MNDYAKSLDLTFSLREPVIRTMIDALQFQAGSRGLDAGCGVGLQAILLAEAVGAEGHITGLDLAPELLAHAQEIVHTAGLAEQISFRQGDVNALPFEDDTFDWAWSVDCVGYAPFDPQPALEELARVVKSGGTVAIAAWSSEQLLPGHPDLEARLKATTAGLAPFAAGKGPEQHLTRALGRLRVAGLEDTAAFTFAGSAFAPLSSDLRRALAALIEMRWPGVNSELAPEEWAAYQRFCLPQSPDFILDLPDYYAFYTYSLFSGKVPG